jgi:prepilin-type N-terminal cleavage/methylation domain-containing protein
MNTRMKRHPALLPAHTAAPPRRSQRGFTMIEIAISLAVIGFALVAIIGILPTGMNVQKENREDTIIAQDATMFLEAIRGGQRGLNDLTNYVFAITNYESLLDSRGVPQAPVRVGYTLNTPFGITNGYRIIGLLSRPKYLADDQGRVYSNHMVAFVRSLSGQAGEKAPQTNQTVRQFAFGYRLILDNVPATTHYFDPLSTNFTDPNIRGFTNELTLRSNTWVLARNFETNLHDLRLTFRWPLLPGGTVGSGRQVFRTLAGGAILYTNEPGFPGIDYTLCFMNPRDYRPTKAQ